MIVADTGAVLALLDADDRHHATLRGLFERRPSEWVVPWAVLPEIDYLVATRLGRRTQAVLLEDLAAGAFTIEWGRPADLARAHKLDRDYESLGLGLVDGAVIAIAERLGARAIATLDLRHFAAVEILGEPLLLPRDG